ncbi:uncharacterized protein EDB91DRAFT_1041824, partial [Suillus paluster]|uniref:uncharacterized protein n=1 Tax=Suillus paluster TaxID=48578 RepID=UPI001B87C574
YSRDAHMHCAQAGIAPRLRGFEQLPGGWYMAVMDKLVAYNILADLPIGKCIPQCVFDAIREQLKMLHAHQLVHGDIRDTNILLKMDDRTKFMIINFNWVGVEEVVRYPAFVNYRDIQRPNDVKDGQPIQCSS